MDTRKNKTSRYYYVGSFSMGKSKRLSASERLEIILPLRIRFY